MPKVTAENLVTHGGLSLREVTRNAATVIPEKKRYTEPKGEDSIELSTSDSQAYKTTF